MSADKDRQETIYNQRFGDIYFSPEDGLAETRHVFLQGNGLPARWAGRRCFTIAETGFGTGLNFLAAWAAFARSAADGQVLDYVSFEQYPLRPAEIRGLLSDVAAAAGLGRFLEDMLDSYPLRVPGFHRVVLADSRVRLTLVFDDVNVSLPELEAPQGVDAWFLDGFAPAKNPQMWTETLFAQMARLSAPGASVATFTAAGAVRRGLAAAGFAVEKRPGFGAKKHMTVGMFAGSSQAQTPNSYPKRIAIVGGGLAGTACAAVLRGCGFAPVLFDAADRLAAGASGNRTGLYNPRFLARRGPESDFYTAAYAQAVRSLERLSEKHDVSFLKCGALHLITSPEKKKRFGGVLENWGWPAEHLRLLSAVQAAAEAGVPVTHPALFLPDSGTVCPEALCRAWGGDRGIRLENPVDDIVSRKGNWDIGGESFDAVILACGCDAARLAGMPDLPLQTVRGQVTLARATAHSAALRRCLCYGGYIAPARPALHTVGSTFQRWLDDPAVRAEDDRANLEKLAALLPDLAQGLTPAAARAALRVAARDHIPLIGPAGPRAPGLFFSVAHGSHGILSALAGAHLLADMMTGAPYSLPRSTVRALAPGRFVGVTG